MARAQTSQFAQLVTPGLRKVYFDTLEGIAKEFRQIFNILPPKPSNRSGLHFFDDLQVSSLGGFGPKQEGVSIQYDVNVQGATKRYQPFTFGLGFRITEEMQEDDLYGVMTKMSSQLSMAAAFTMEVQAHRLLNNAFGTSGGGTGHDPTGFDSLALIATNHKLLRGGRRANRLTTDLDLSVTALELLMDLGENWVNHSGMPTPIHMSQILCGPALKWIAKELTESELKPYTGNNEVNPLGGEGFRYMIDHYFTDPDQYFILGPKSEHDMNIWVRREPRFQMGDDFDTGDSKAKGTFRMASGYGEPDGIVGSQGA